MNPGCYTRLAPFAELFAQGNPILTYHKVGPRPRRTRLKGLYVSPRLFARQLQELRAAGFANGALSQCAAPRTAATVVITFDDGYANVLEHAVEPLRRAGFKAVQFLPVNWLGQHNAWDTAAGEVPERIMDVAQVRDWLAAGQAIGSHTLSHPHLTRLSTAEAREEIQASKRKLEDLFGRAIEDFCYPFGEWNPAVRDLVVEGGYRTACTTEPGINLPTTDPFALERITARYRSRNWRTVRAWLARRLGLGSHDSLMRAISW